MAAREIPGLLTVLDGIRGAMAPAAAWCERQGVDNIYHLKELGDDGEIDRAGSGKSGGTDVLSGYGSARVDGM